MTELWCRLVSTLAEPGDWSWAGVAEGVEEVKPPLLATPLQVPEEAVEVLGATDEPAVPAA